MQGSVRRKAQAVLWSTLCTDEALCNQPIVADLRPTVMLAGGETRQVIAA